jgi:arylsulfatase
MGGIPHPVPPRRDVVPTILEATGITPPDAISTIKRPMDGVSMAYT